MMKILYVVHQFFPLHYTGTERFVLNVSGQMQRMGHEVKVLTYAIVEGDGFKKRGLYLAREYEYQGIPVISIRHEAPPETVSFSVYDRTMEPLIESMLRAEKFDVVHVAHPMRLGAVVRAAKKLGIPVVLTLTDFWLACPRGIAVMPDSELCRSPEMGAKCVRRCFGEPWSDRIARRFAEARDVFDSVDACVSPTHFLADMVKGTFGREIRVVRHGIDYRGVVPNGRPEKGQRDVVFGYIGTILPHKGVHLIVEAVRTMPNQNVKARIYGNYFGEKAYFEGLKKAAGGDPRIEFMGEYRDEEMPAIMGGVDCIVAPSTWWENSPLTVLTSFAYRVPVITISVGGAAELVQDGVNGLHFDIGDARGLADRMARIADDPGVLERLKGGIVRPPRNEEEAFEYEKIYAAVAAKKKGAALRAPASEAPKKPAEATPPVDGRRAGFIDRIDPRDRTYQNLARRAAGGNPGFGDPEKEYFRGGEAMIECLDEVLADHNRTYADVGSLLDFDCGYGVFTRFAAGRLDPGRIAVSDIDRAAVDFCVDTFKVRGFYPAADPGGIAVQDKFDVIWAGSLFCRLPGHAWVGWLRRLHDMLSDGGILVFSTHGMFAYAHVGEDAKRSIKKEQDGLYFLPRGLDAGEEGTTYASYDFVKNLIESNGLGMITAFYDHRLRGKYDIYAMRKIGCHGAPAARARGITGPASEGVSREISPRDAMFNGDHDQYFGVGYSALDCIRSAMAVAKTKSVRRVLDFPCGHGRVLRWLRAEFPGARISACDLDRDGVDFCAKTFGAVPAYSDEDPAKVRIEGDFDLIWVGSLFTHFDKDRWDEFLGFFIDHLAPNGLLVFTTHGRRPIEWIRRGFNRSGLACEQYYGRDGDRLRQTIDGYDRGGFDYFDYPSQHYGLSFSSPAWVLAKLQKYADIRVVMCLEHGWYEHHDVIACVKTIDR